MAASIFTFINNGGPIIWILLAFSVVAVAVTIYKLLSFWQLREKPRGTALTARKHLELGKRSQALILVQGQSNPRAQVFCNLLHSLESGLNADAIRDEAMRQARSLLAKLGSNLKILEVIAITAPLIGLFGTVLGMIEAFKAMEAAGSAVNPAVLSGGIWQALLTTAAGMAVAIPVTMIHSWFDQTVQNQALNMQDDIDFVLTLEAQKAINKKAAQSA